MVFGRGRRAYRHGGICLAFCDGVDRHVLTVRKCGVAEHGDAVDDLAGGIVHAASQVRRIYCAAKFLSVVRDFGDDDCAMRGVGGLGQGEG